MKTETKETPAPPHIELLPLRDDDDSTEDVTEEITLPESRVTTLSSRRESSFGRATFLVIVFSLAVSIFLAVKIIRVEFGKGDEGCGENPCPPTNLDGMTTAIKSIESKKCVERHAENSKLFQNGCHFGQSQMFKLLDKDKGYAIVSEESGKCMDVKAASVDAGASVQESDCHFGENQLWRVRPLGGSFHVQSVKSGFCLDTFKGSKEDMASLIQWYCSNSNLWEMSGP